MTKSSVYLFIKKYIQCNAYLAITGSIRGSSREKTHQKVGLESLQYRRSYRKLCYIYKTYNEKSPEYLYFQLISLKNHHVPLETLIIFHSSNFVIFFSKIRFFRPQ